MFDDDHKSMIDHSDIHKNLSKDSDTFHKDRHDHDKIHESMHLGEDKISNPFSHQ